MPPKKRTTRQPAGGNGRPGKATQRTTSGQEGPARGTRGLREQEKKQPDPPKGKKASGRKSPVKEVAPTTRGRGGRAGNQPPSTREPSLPSTTRQAPKVGGQQKGREAAKPPTSKAKGQGNTQQYAGQARRDTKRRQGDEQQGAPSPNFMQDISVALANISRRLDEGAYPRAARGEECEPGPAARGGGRRRQHQELSDSSASPSPERQGANERKRRRPTSRKSKRCCRGKGESSTESSSGESSSSDEEQGDEDYWGEGAEIPGIPRWAARRRRARGDTNPMAWEQGGRGKAKKGPAFTDDEDPPGIHLSKKLRRAILKGHYVDIFRLLKPEREEANTGTRHREPKRRRKQEVERNFDNWLEGYAEFTGVVQSAYPERGWHLNNHYKNVLKARKLAGDAAAMAYDEAFRERASQSSAMRWDLINSQHWLVEVGPSVKGRREGARYMRGTRQAMRRVCWEYNAGRCGRAKCRFDHDCEACFGPHPRVSCTRQRAGQQPFRAPRPPSKPNIQRDTQGGGAVAAYGSNTQK